VNSKAWDNVLLLIAATCASAFAWGFWHLLGETGSTVLLTIAVIALLIDNVRLRRKQR
jgi:hypothetical protein